MLYHLEEKVKERTSELSATQAQLIQQEKMASLGVMVAGIGLIFWTGAFVLIRVAYRKWKGQ